MNTNTTERVGKIIGNLKDKDMQEEVQSVVVSDPAIDLRNNILTFFDSRINAIKSQEDLKILVQNKLTEKLESEDLSVAQLKDLFVVLSRETTNASQDIMAMVQPSDAFNKPASPMDHALEDISGDQQRKLDLLFRFLEKSKFDPES